MKKINSIMIMLAIFVSLNSSYAQNNNWFQVSASPQTGSDCFLIGNTTFVLPFSGSVGYFSNNLFDANAWVPFPLPVMAEDIQSYTVFQGKIFIGGNGWIYVSDDNGFTWTPLSINPGNFWSLSASDQYIYAYGWVSGTYENIALKSPNGIIWSSMSINADVDVSFAHRDTVCAVVNYNYGVASYFVLFQSFDSGESWQVTDTVERSVALAGGIYNGYCHIVGSYVAADTADDIWPMSWGRYNYKLYSAGGGGGSFGTTEFNGHNYTCAGYNNGINYYNGAVIMDGDTNNQAYVDDYLWGICSSSTLCVANGYDHLYVLADPTVVAENNKAEFHVYPNPTTGIVNITSSSKTEINIYNITSLKVGHYNLSSGQNRIDLSPLPSGFYLIKSSDGEWTQKIIKQ